MTATSLDFSTIAAISTPPGSGGIAVVRMSGTDAAAIARQIFRRPDGSIPDLDRQSSHRVFYGQVVDPRTGALIDEVLLTWMAAPNTYTTEDTVEISCHGGTLPVRETLRVMLAAGARHAEPGEFTLRAFVNGRLDLSQAEAVLNVVGARTAEGLQLAVEDLRGDLNRRIAPARDAVITLLAWLDAAADFPEDEIPGTDVDGDLATALGALEAIVAGSREGMLYREGAQVALVGRPNVGKSSLMNALLRSDRAIVTPIAGTTRDIVAESTSINGIPVTLQDTAGIAETADIVEQLGIERSQRAMTSAAAVIFVIDGSVEPTNDDLAVAEQLSAKMAGWAPAEPPASVSENGPPIIVAINKRDLPATADQSVIISKLPGAPVIELSSKTGEGLRVLEDALATMLGSDDAIQPALITARQRAALERALTHLTNAAQTRESGFPLDLMATDVRAALHAIGEVTGENVDEAVLNEIFSRFCIGK